MFLLIFFGFIEVLWGFDLLHFSMTSFRRKSFFYLEIHDHIFNISMRKLDSSPIFNTTLSNWMNTLLQRLFITFDKTFSCQNILIWYFEIQPSSYTFAQILSWSSVRLQLNFIQSLGLSKSLLQWGHSVADSFVIFFEQNGNPK